MKKKVKLSIVFPALNEEKNITKSISSAVKFAAPLGEYEVIVVDDGSTDSTRAEVLKYKGENNCIHLISHKKNRGYGAAVWDGLKAAKGDLIFFTDSDMQFKINELKKFINTINDCDVVIGFRKKRSEGFSRKLNMLAWRSLARVFLSLKFKDIDCAFKLFKSKVIKKIKVESTGAMFSAELLYRINQHGFKVIELPVNHYLRVYGKPTGANPKVIIRALREFFGFYEKTKRERAST